MRLLAFIFALASGVAGAQEPPLEPGQKAAVEQLEKLAAENPREAVVLFQLARTYVRVGWKDKALATFSQVRELRTGIEPVRDVGWDTVWDDARFQAELGRLRAQHPPVKRAVEAYRGTDAELIPEGLAYDPVRRRLLIGSMYRNKIVAIERDGRWHDLVAPMPGLVPLGLKVIGNELWVVSQPLQPRADTAPGVFRFAAADGKLLGKTEIRGEGVFLNDLQPLPNGDVFVTDTNGGSVYRIRRAGRTVEHLVPPGAIRWSNGIAADAAGKQLFVANWRGIWRIDPGGGPPAMLRTPERISASGVDGLYFYKGSLIGVQNSTHPGRVVRWFLNPAMDAIVREEVLESGSEHLAVPTTGALAGDEFFFIANSYVAELGDDGKLKHPGRLKPTVIMKVPLG